MNSAPLALIVAAFVGAIPSIAALVAIVWYAILIWESQTMKQWRTRHYLKKLAKVKAKEQVLLSLIGSHVEDPLTHPDKSTI